jgi:hypothetical protein
MSLSLLSLVSMKSRCEILFRILFNFTLHQLVQINDVTRMLDLVLPFCIVVWSVLLLYTRLQLHWNYFSDQLFSETNIHKILMYDKIKNVQKVQREVFGPKK